MRQAADEAHRLALEGLDFTAPSAPKRLQLLDQAERRFLNLLTAIEARDWETGEKAQWEYTAAMGQAEILHARARLARGEAAAVAFRAAHDAYAKAARARGEPPESDREARSAVQIGLAETAFALGNDKQALRHLRGLKTGLSPEQAALVDLLKARAEDRQAARTTVERARLEIAQGKVDEGTGMDRLRMVAGRLRFNRPQTAAAARFLREVQFMLAFYLQQLGLRERDQLKLEQARDLTERLRRDSGNEFKGGSESKSMNDDAIAAAGRILQTDPELWRAASGPPTARLARLHAATRTFLQLDARWLLPADHDPDLAAAAWPERAETLYLPTVRKRLLALCAAWTAGEPDSLVRTFSHEQRARLARDGHVRRWLERFQQAYLLLEKLDALALIEPKHGDAPNQEQENARAKLLTWQAQLQAERAQLAEAERSAALAREAFDAAAEARDLATEAQRLQARAQERYAQLVKDEPKTDSVELHFQIGESYRKGGRPARAIAHYQAVLGPDTSPERMMLARLGLAEAFLHLKQFDDAYDAFSDVLADDRRVTPHDRARRAEAELGMARARLLQGQQRGNLARHAQRAVELLEALLARLSPRAAVAGEATFLLGAAHLALAQHYEATDLEASLRASKTPAPGRRNRTERPEAPDAKAFAAKHYALAVTNYEEALARYPLGRYRRGAGGLAAIVRARTLPAVMNLAHACRALGRGQGRRDPAYLTRAAKLYRLVAENTAGSQRKLGGDATTRAQLAPRAAALRIEVLYELAAGQRPLERLRTLAELIQAADRMVQRFPHDPRTPRTARLAFLARQAGRPTGAPATPTATEARLLFERLGRQNPKQTPEALSARFWREQLEYESRGSAKASPALSD